MKVLRLTFIILFVGIASQINAQIFDRLSKKVEETVNKRLEQETQEKTDEVLDEVFEGGDDKQPEKVPTNYPTNTNQGPQNTGNPSSPVIVTGDNSLNSASSAEIVSGSTFFPNGEIIYEEKFQMDATGDFPAEWETTMGGEVILIDGTKALRMYPNSLCIANTGALPENYAMEFDFTTANLNYDELSGANFRVQLTNEHTLNVNPHKYSRFYFSLWQGSSVPDQINVYNQGADFTINNNVSYKINEKLNGTMHFTVVVNGKRFRLYIENDKVIDIPSFLQNDAGRYVQFYLHGTEPTLNHIVAISNIKITEESEDIRSLLMKGGFSTTKILFDSGSDQIKSDSYQFLNKVGKALESDSNMKVMIIGHTDSDGDDNANLSLSQKRAASVKSYLTSNFNIPAGNLQTDGKGENDPVSDNSTEAGKSKNRRVEFKKI